MSAPCAKQKVVLEEVKGEIDRGKYCDRCWGMTTTFGGLKALASEDGYEMYNKQELLDSSTRGCPLCCLISEDSKDWVSETEKKLRISATSETVRSKDVSNGIDHPFKRHSIAFFKYSLPFASGLRVFTTKGDPAEPFVVRRSPFREIVSNTAFEYYRTWLRECEAFHACVQRNNTPRLPTRVINVGSLNTNSVPKLHLSKKGEKGRYAALSYCWGRQQDFTTTVKTLHERIQGFGVDVLPKTISDAIIVAQRLDIQYLWVDSLCIIQDSAPDKIREISKMGDTYRKATVTIAAASARGVTEGFLFDRLPDDPSLPFYLSHSTSGTISFSTVANSDGRNDPLSTRGWAFQEFVLSPRVILFDKFQATWHCSENLCKEVVPSYLRYNVGPRLTYSYVKRNGQTASDADSWRSIIRDYASSDLTFFEDRLTAISGVVKDLAKVWRDDYLAGFWRNSLVHLLSWKRKTDKYINFQHLRSKGRIGSPSWSWKTAPFGIYLNPVDEPVIELIDCHVTLLSPFAPFGEVIEGVLTLRGKIFPIPDGTEVKGNGNNWVQYNLDYDSVKLDNSMRLLLLGDGSNGPLALIIRELENGRFERIGLYEQRYGISDNSTLENGSDQIIIME